MLLLADIRGLPRRTAKAALLAMTLLHLHVERPNTLAQRYDEVIAPRRAKLEERSLEERG